MILGPHRSSDHAATAAEASTFPCASRSEGLDPALGFRVIEYMIRNIIYESMGILHDHIL